MRRETHGAPKKSANLSINARLLKMAKKRKINLSATLEAALVDRLRTQEESEWLAENQRSLSEYRVHVDRDGTFGDKLRRF